MIGSTRYVSAAEIARQTRLSEDITKLQTSVSSRKRLAAASDDPVAAARVSAISKAQANNGVYETNIDSGSAIASAADTQLSAVQNALTRAKELLLKARTGTASTADQISLASEITSIATDIQNASGALDPNGNPLFPAGTPNAIPVTEGLSIAATTSSAAAFGGVATAGGAKTIAQILAAVQTAIQTGDTSGMTTSLSEVDAAAAHVSGVQTDQGLRQARFTQVKSQLQDSDTDLTIERSSLEDTDMTYALSEIAAKQTALQAAQTIFAQSMKTNLFTLLG